MLLLSLLFACDIPPNHVETADIDNALARKHYKTMCVGLQMTDDALRTYTTERMRSIVDDDGIAVAEACVCENITHESMGWDRAIAAGLVGKQGDGMVDCFAALVADPALEDREDAINQLAQIPAPIARQTLSDIATSTSPGAERARAIMAIGSHEDFRGTIIPLLEDQDPAVRAAAADALGDGSKNGEVKTALRAALDDEEGTVRAAVLRALKKLAGPGADEAICAAMMNDPEEVVREAAVLSYQGTRRDTALECLRERAMTQEDSASVREAMLTVLKSSPADGAADILCDAIPFWVRTYLKEDIPDKIPGTDIIKAQNDRDWERSYECVARAARSGGSCYARMYTGYWLNQLGGSAHIPACPRYTNP